MAETTGIAWTDSTFNPWIGCTKVGPGCDHCYAEALDNRHRWKGATHWGAGKPRMITSPQNWRKPLQWNAKAKESGQQWKVFCASLADVFDNEVPEQWRSDLWELIAATPSLTWLLLTKRIGNALKMMPTLDGAMMAPMNVWLGATIVNQEEADRDIPKLLATPAAIRFVSYEPALGPVDWTKFPGIDWIIVGGESTQGGKAREFHVEWAENTIKQARAIGAAPFIKQLGSNLADHGGQPAGDWWPRQTGMQDTGRGYFRRHLVDYRAGADPTEWRPSLRVQEFPLG